MVAFLSLGVTSNQVPQEGATAPKRVNETASLLDDPKIATPYVDRALQYLRKTSSPENLVGNETAAKALIALAAGKHEEAYDLAVAAGVNPGEHNAPFVAGIAALHLKRWDDAARAFTTMMESRSKLGVSALVACTYIMLGRAHADPSVLALWSEFEGACEYVPIAGVPEAGQPFSEFEALPP